MTEPTIHFDQLNLVCTDLPATVAFYRRLGVAIPEERIWTTASGAHHVSDVPLDPPDLELDSLQLADVYNAGHRDRPLPGAVVLGFTLPTRDAVDRLHAELVAAGHPSRQEPYDAFWGARYAIVADPDGRDVGVMSPSDLERRTPPPEL